MAQRVDQCSRGDLPLNHEQAALDRERAGDAGPLVGNDCASRAETIEHEETPLRIFHAQAALEAVERGAGADGIVAHEGFGDDHGRGLMRAHSDIAGKTRPREQNEGIGQDLDEAAGGRLDQHLLSGVAAVHAVHDR